MVLNRKCQTSRASEPNGRWFQVRYWELTSPPGVWRVPERESDCETVFHTVVGIASCFASGSGIGTPGFSLNGEKFLFLNKI